MNNSNNSINNINNSINSNSIYFPISFYNSLKYYKLQLDKDTINNNESLYHQQVYWFFNQVRKRALAIVKYINKFNLEKSYVAINCDTNSLEYKFIQPWNILALYIKCLTILHECILQLQAFIKENINKMENIIKVENINMMETPKIKVRNWKNLLNELYNDLLKDIDKYTNKSIKILNTVTINTSSSNINNSKTVYNINNSNNNNVYVDLYHLIYTSALYSCSQGCIKEFMNNHKKAISYYKHAYYLFQQLYYESKEAKYENDTHLLKEKLKSIENRIMFNQSKINI